MWTSVCIQDKWIKWTVMNKEIIIFRKEKKKTHIVRLENHKTIIF